MADTDLEEVLEGTVDEVKEAVRENDFDLEKMKKLEKQGKDRKTVNSFLEKRIDSSSGSESSEGTESSDEEKKASGNEGSSSSKTEKLMEPLEDLESLSSVQGAAVVRRDGLLIASNLEGDIDDDQVGAMTASIVGSGETASESLRMGDVAEVTVESEDGKLIATGAGGQGIVAVLTDQDVNMGLIKVEIKDAVNKVKQVL
ncbi:MAG: roadblock/LC7 domain-containing protein [Candidatus Nanohalobium sp.]